MPSKPWHDTALCVESVITVLRLPRWWFWTEGGGGGIRVDLQTQELLYTSSVNISTRCETQRLWWWQWLYLLLLFTFTVCHPWIESTQDWVLMLSNLSEKLVPPPLFLSFFLLFAILMKVGWAFIVSKGKMLVIGKPYKWITNNRLSKNSMKKSKQTAMRTCICFYRLDASWPSCF